MRGGPLGPVRCHSVVCFAVGLFSPVAEPQRFLRTPSLFFGRIGSTGSLGAGAAQRGRVFPFYVLSRHPLSSLASFLPLLASAFVYAQTVLKRGAMGWGWRFPDGSGLVSFSIFCASVAKITLY
jgi:hypothetical protein